MALKQKIIFAIALIIGVIIQILPIIRSGLNYSYGIGFWGPNGHDAVWHLSLINHISNPLVINMPVFAGEKLNNYHPFFDILIKFFSNITHISSSIWLFQIFPIFSAILLLSLSYIFGYLITGTFSGGVILMSLNTIANSFGWIVTLLKFGNFSGESIFWAMQSPSNQINPPYNLSLIFILIILIIIYRRFSSFLTVLESVSLFIILSVLPITKAYSAIIGFSVVGFYCLKNKTIKNWLLLFFSILSSYSIFSLYNHQSTGLLIYKPFWFVNSMIDSIDKLSLDKLSSFRNTLESLPIFDKRLILVYIFSFFLFIIGNFGWRLLGILKINLKNYFHFILVFNIILLVLIPTLFIQKSTSWNTIQFLYYALFLSNIFLTIFLNDIFSKTFGKILISFIFVTYILALIGSSPNYLGKIPPSSLPNSEQNALNFLSQQPSGTVLTVPYDQYLKNNFSSTPIPLYAYETTAYVSAYSQHLVFLEDEMNSQNSGYDSIGRRQSEINFFTQKNIFQDRGFLVNNQIDYIYLTGFQIQRFPLHSSELSLEKIYDNEDCLIYHVQR